MSQPLAIQHALRAPMPIRRELLVLAAALAFGVLAVPPLLWVVGSRALGPYAGGGIGAFLASFFRGLASGTFGFWMVALGPYLLTLVARALGGLARGSAGR
jgi:hypothetical protein